MTSRLFSSFHWGLFAIPRVAGSTASGFTPFFLLMAFATSKLFGNPCPCIHATSPTGSSIHDGWRIESRISNPASSTAQPMRWYVRVPPKARRWPPGFKTRSTSAQKVGSKAIPVPSHWSPMKPFPWRLCLP